MNDTGNGASRKEGGTERKTDWDGITARARAMVPTLRTRAKEAERLRRLPEQTDREFREAGFYRVMQPKAYGGLELDFGIQTELAVELAPGCASSAWVASVTACHGWILGMFPPEAQDDVWGTDPDATIASSFLPLSPQVRRDGDGLRLSGRWGFPSGVDYCRWIILTVAIAPEGEEGARRSLFALVPLKDCAIEDNWHTTGLAGTGSNGVLLDELYVPVHRIVDMQTLRGGPTPGSAANPGYLYRLPQRATFSFNLVGTAIGAARGTIEMAIEELVRRNTVGGVKLAEQSSVQLRIAEAEAELGAAYALMARNREEIIRQGKAGISPSIEDRARYRRDNAYVTRLCVQAVDRVYPIMGGRGIAADNAVNRAWRDVHAVAHHIALTWDVQAAAAGALAVGLPPPDPLL